MTTSKTIPNVILAQGTENEVTCYIQSFEKIYSKKLVGITSPQSTANYGSGPNATRIVDLLRIEIRFSVRCYIDSEDETKIENLLNAGGTFGLLWKGTTFNVNFEKLAETDTRQEEQDETSITFTTLVGVNL